MTSNKRFNLLIPIAGRGQRFVDAGYQLPKQLLMLGNRTTLDVSLDCVDREECNLIFVIRDDHEYNFNLGKILKKKYGPDTQVIVQTGFVNGSVKSCMFAVDLIDNDMPLIIHTLDVEFSPKFNPASLLDKNADGILLTFQSNSSNYSYVESDDDGNAVRTAEKQVISNDAITGIYGFRRGSDFCAAARQMIDEDRTTNGEFYIAPLYNILIEQGKIIRTTPVSKMYIFGTPQEFLFYIRNVIPTFGDKPIGLCSDHSGYQAKENIKDVLKSLGLDFIDYGASIDYPSNYKAYIDEAANGLRLGHVDFVFGFCRTGQGVNICANKIPDIRSALVYNKYAMEMAIRHNCANFFAIPAGQFKYQEELREFVEVALAHSFDGGRHQQRVMEIEG